MKIVSLLFLSATFYSCSYFLPKENKPKTQIDTIIDYTTIDAYPILPECDEIASKELQKACFYKFLTKRVQKKITQINLESNLKSNDTISIKFIVNSKGLTYIKSIQASERIKNEFKNLDSIITASFNDLPQMKPALKRGIPVKTEYSIPIVIVMN